MRTVKGIDRILFKSAAGALDEDGKKHKVYGDPGERKVTELWTYSVLENNYY